TLSSKPGAKRSRNKSHKSSRNDFRSLRDALRTARQGDLSIRLPTNRSVANDGKEQVALAFNSFMDLVETLVHELDRVSRGVGVEGKIEQRASLGPVDGAWSAAVDSVNKLIENMAW